MKTKSSNFTKNRSVPRRGGAVGGHPPPQPPGPGSALHTPQVLPGPACTSLPSRARPGDTVTTPDPSPTWVKELCVCMYVYKYIYIYEIEIYFYSEILLGKNSTRKSRCYWFTSGCPERWVLSPW